MTGLTVGKDQFAVMVKKKASRVRSGIEQRDSSIRAGADGATTYVVKGSKFQVPSFFGQRKGLPRHCLGEAAEWVAARGWRRCDSFWVRRQAHFTDWSHKRRPYASSLTVPLRHPGQTQSSALAMKS